MNIIIFDLEWNQPQVSKKRHRGLIGEIIQIGAAKVDLAMKVQDSFSIVVKPVFYTKMNRDVKELTLITNEDLENGVPFKEAVEQFRSWCGEDPVFLSWGPSDSQVLRNNLEVFELDRSWLPVTLDAQLMFDDQEMQEDRQWPLNYALYHYSERPDGVHNALADVYSTALVLAHLNMEECIGDEYFICDDGGETGYKEDGEDAPGPAQ